MSLVLLYPAALFALLALLLPLLLHLRRRSEDVAVDFSALPWLAAHMKPRRRPRLDKLWLLLMRLLLLALIALWLAQPLIHTDRGPRHWQLVSPGVDIRGIAELAGDAADYAFWLAPGFPSIREPRPLAAANTASLLREYDAAIGDLDALRIWVPAIIDGLDGERIRLRRAIDWRIALTQTEDVGHTLVPTEPPALRISLRLDEESRPSARYVRAAIVAWYSRTESSSAGDAATQSAPGLRAASPTNAGADLSSLEFSDALPELKSDGLIWLRAGELPPPIVAWISAGGTALVARTTRVQTSTSAVTVWRGTEGEPLVLASGLGRGRLLQLQRELLPAAMPVLLDARFPGQLRTLFEPTKVAPRRADSKWVKPLIGAPAASITRHSMDEWLIALILISFAIERWLATAPRKFKRAQG